VGVAYVALIAAPGKMDVVQDLEQLGPKILRVFHSDCAVVVPDETVWDRNPVEIFPQKAVACQLEHVTFIGTAGSW
jgi:hypothetical protein